MTSDSPPSLIWFVLLKHRPNQHQCFCFSCNISEVTRFFFLFIIKNNIYRIKVSKQILQSFPETKVLLSTTSFALITQNEFSFIIASEFMAFVICFFHLFQVVPVSRFLSIGCYCCQSTTLAVCFNACSILHWCCFRRCTGQAPPETIDLHY